MIHYARLGFCLLSIVPLVGCGELANPVARSVDDPAWRNPNLAKRGVDLYRVGTEWSRTPVSNQIVQDLPTHEQHWVLRTGRARYPGGSGTAFILGKHQNRWWALSNRHVFYSPAVCGVATFSFPMLEITARCVRRLEAWNEHDLAILEIEFLDQPEPTDLPVLRLPSSPSLDRSMWLASAGFGVAGHENEIPLTLNRDTDCRAFSSTPFDRQLGSEYVHSFAHGCDVSPGDSGSPIWERETGRWAGVVWSGIVPKSDLVQDSLELTRWLTLAESQDSPAWETLNFGVSLAATRLTWSSTVESASTPPELRDLLAELLAL